MCIRDSITYSPSTGLALGDAPSLELVEVVQELLQRARLHRLGEVVVEASLDRLALVFRLTVTRERDQHDARAFGLSSNHLCHFVTVELRQPDVDEGNIMMTVQDLLHGLF